MHALEYTSFYDHSSHVATFNKSNWAIIGIIIIIMSPYCCINILLINYYYIVFLLLHKYTTYIIVLILQQKVDPSLQVDVKMSAYHQVWRIKQRMAAEQEWKRRQMENVYRFVSCRVIRQSQNRFLALIGWIENDTLALIGLRIISQLSLVEVGDSSYWNATTRRCARQGKRHSERRKTIFRGSGTSDTVY